METERKLLPYYLTGTTHWLTKGAAYAHAQRDAPSLAVADSDGTWSVYHLSETPRQTGQVLFREPLAEHKLFEVK